MTFQKTKDWLGLQSKLLILKSKNWIALQWNFLYAKFVHIFVFVVVNVFIGSLGVWMTMLMSGIGKYNSFQIELSRTLAAGGPYTFAVAYLAASTSYVAYEYLEGERTASRKLKTALTTAAFVMIILCTLLSAFQSTIAETDNLTPPQAQTTLAQQAVQNSNVNNVASSTEVSLKDNEKLQLALVLISVLIGLILYVISRWDDEDSVRMLEEYEKRISEESLALANRANQAVKNLKL